jgi:hypothetical protein
MKPSVTVRPQVSTPRFTGRVLANTTLMRRSSDCDAANHRPQVLQRHSGFVQLSLFSSLEPVTRPLSPSGYGLHGTDLAGDTANGDLDGTFDAA